MKKHISTILIVVIFLVGLSVMLYPTVSNWYNERSSSYVVDNYKNTIDKIDETEYEKIMEEARAYNKELLANPHDFISGSPEHQNYIDSLDVLNGMMGYVEIDKININLPIYHGTDESVLQKAVGHLEGSTLPTGDVLNNTVLTGHTGLPSAELFTDLSKIDIGDTFELFILNEVFTYEVFDILVVTPREVDTIEAVDGKDVVTLVTCTPYGVNSHRLLVRGEQIEVEPQIELGPETPTTTQTNDDETGLDLSNLLSPVVIIILIIIAILLVVLIIIKTKKSNTINYKRPE